MTPPRLRRPNPWIAVPSLVAGLIGGTLGWVINEVSCRPEGCPLGSAVVAILGALAGSVGLAVVLVLTYRSIAEWRDK